MHTCINAFAFPQWIPSRDSDYGMLFDESIDDQVLVKYLKNLSYNRFYVYHIKFSCKTLPNLPHLYSIHSFLSHIIF